MVLTLTALPGILCTLKNREVCQCHHIGLSILTFQELMNIFLWYLVCRVLLTFVNTHSFWLKSDSSYSLHKGVIFLCMPCITLEAVRAKNVHNKTRRGKWSTFYMQYALYLGTAVLVYPNSVSSHISRTIDLVFQHVPAPPVLMCFCTTASDISIYNLGMCMQ